MPFRKIHNAGRRMNVCKFPSQKNSQNIWTESILELYFAIMCENDRNVISYSTQAVRIYYELNGKRRSYTADFLCYQRIGRPLVVEIKRQRQITPWFEQLFRIITPICDREGFDFAVKTERDILVEPLLTTLKRLPYYSRIPIHPEHQLLCRDFLSRKAAATLAETFDFFESRGHDRRVVLALMYHNFVLTDYSIPLNLTSPVWLPDSKETNPGGDV
jgi:hypothetical protein